MSLDLARVRHGPVGHLRHVHRAQFVFHRAALVRRAVCEVGQDTAEAGWFEAQLTGEVPSHRLVGVLVRPRVAAAAVGPHPGERALRSRPPGEEHPPVDVDDVARAGEVERRGGPVDRRLVGRPRRSARRVQQHDLVAREVDRLRTRTWRPAGATQRLGARVVEGLVGGQEGGVHCPPVPTRGHSYPSGRRRAGGLPGGGTGNGIAVTAPTSTPPNAPPARTPRRGAAGRTAAAAALATSALLGYLLYRAMSAGADIADRAGENAASVVAVQGRLHIGVEPALQAALGGGAVGALLVAVYAVAYWPGVLAGFLVAAFDDREQLRRLVWAVAASGLVGLVVIATFPVTPPRLIGALDDQIAGTAIASIAHPSGWFHPHAAMPSFHVTWTSLAAAAMRPRLGYVAWCLPGAMSVAVVTTGNHWVLDVVAGWVLAACAWWAAPIMHRLAVRGLAQHERFAHLREESDACVSASS